MSYGICALSVIPIRYSASDTSEMVSQLLFGEAYEVVSVKSKWLKIRCSHDKYEGWISKNQHTEAPEKVKDEALSATNHSLEVVHQAIADKYFIPILLGSAIPEYDGINFKLNGNKYTFNGQVINLEDTPKSAELLIKIARKYLNAPYLWGGRSPFGIDCSGFVQVVFKIMGFKFDRDASQQVHHGEVVNLPIESKPGDLAFFENKKGDIIHVGIILENQEIIHASGKVRIDKFDHQGIFNQDLGKYTHKLRIIKRVIAN